jgi:leucine-rich repeat protein SHOC2
MEQAELEQIIEQARLDRSTTLHIFNYQSTILPDSLCSLSDLVSLYITHSQLTTIPENIGNLTNCEHLCLAYNSLAEIPESIGNLTNCKHLILDGNDLTKVPESIGDLTNCEHLDLLGNNLSSFPEGITRLSNLRTLNLCGNPMKSLSENIGNLSSLNSLQLAGTKLSRLPSSIGDLTNLTFLNLNRNQISILPESIARLTKLAQIILDHNPLTDLSILQDLPVLREVQFLGAFLSRHYWSKFSEWKPEWLLYPFYTDNAEIRRILIEQVGYEKICKELNAISLDNWREYTLIKIDGVDVDVYDFNHARQEDETIGQEEPMVLLKMTCPSTQHIHILRVPPEMTSAEAAITWVNHGIHPDEFAVQT